MKKNLLIAYVIVFLALLSSCFSNPLEQFQPTSPRQITPILSDENISFALA